MTDLPTKECRAELRAAAIRQRDFKNGVIVHWTAEEKLALLDATEPVTDAEVAKMVDRLHRRQDFEQCHYHDADARFMRDAAALLERLARHLADLRAGRIGVDRVESQPFTPPHEDE